MLNLLPCLLLLPLPPPLPPIAFNDLSSAAVWACSFWMFIAMALMSALMLLLGREHDAIVIKQVGTKFVERCKRGERTLASLNDSAGRAGIKWLRAQVRPHLSQNGYGSGGHLGVIRGSSGGRMSPILVIRRSFESSRRALKNAHAQGSTHHNLR